MKPVLPYDHRLTTALETLLTPLSYDGVDAWRSAVGEALKDLLRADVAIVKLPSDVLEGAVPAYSDDVDLHHLGRYDEALAPLDTRFDAWARAAALGVCDRRSLWGDDLATYYASPYFHEFIRPMGVFGTALITFGSGLPEASGSSTLTYGSATQFIVARCDRRAEFDGGGEATFQFGEEDLRALSLLQPAAQAGVETLRHLARYASALARAVDATGAALLLADEHGRELHRTPALVDLLASPGLPGHRSDRLVEGARRYAESVAARDAAGVARCSDSVRPYRLSGTLLEGIGQDERLVAVLVTHERSLTHACGLVSEGEMLDRFGLTQQQARVALLLAERWTNAEIADALCISPHTAHRHTHAVLQKLDVGSRRDVRARLLDRDDYLRKDVD